MAAEVATAAILVQAQARGWGCRAARAV